LDKADLLWLLGSLERNSEHPLALAVVSYAESNILAILLDEQPFAQPTSFQALTGRGASGKIGGIQVAIGNRAFFAMKKIEVAREVEDAMLSLENDGKTVILAVVDEKIAAVMGVTDELKPDATDVLNYLQNQMGVDMWMVTGNNAWTAIAISQQLGLSLDRIISEALPVAKVQQVKKL
jgi:Cu+-exporting ATPase